MGCTTIKRAIKDALENLSEIDYLKFCDELLDRREEPTVSRSAVEKKKSWEVAELLVETYSGKARQVALEVLRGIKCNASADSLESNTKTCTDKGDPTLPKTPTGELVTNASEEALKYAATCHPVKTPDEVEAEAKACVLAEGGDPNIEWLILSRFAIQLGKYKGQTFKWLLENDVGYVIWLVKEHQDDRQRNKLQSPLMANKDSLAKYARMYCVSLRASRKTLTPPSFLPSFRVLVIFTRSHQGPSAHQAQQGEAEKISDEEIGLLSSPLMDQGCRVFVTFKHVVPYPSFPRAAPLKDMKTDGLLNSAHKTIEKDGTLRNSSPKNVIFYHDTFP